MMKERYESLPLNELRQVAKARGLKGISALRKDQLVERMLQEDEKDQAKKAAEQSEESKTERADRHERSAKQDRTERRERNEKQERTAERQEAPERNEQPERAETEKARPVNDGEDHPRSEFQALDSGQEVCGILEVLADGYGFIRSDNFLPGDNDVYVSPSQIRRFGLKTGDILRGNTRIKSQNEKFSALLYVKSVNGMNPSESARRFNFEDMTPIFPNKRIRLERPGGSLAMRIVDLVSPIGKGQRGMIVSPPKAGKPPF